MTLANMDGEKECRFDVEVRGLAVKGVKGRILKAESISDHNTFEDPDRVKPVDLEGIAREGNTLKISLPAASVVALQIA